jgi:orotate phosphoribosyltransferase
MPAASPRHPDLARFVAQHALRRGAFTLASGKVSDVYWDCRLVSLDPRGLSLVVDAILREIADTPLDAIGGPTIGADPIVAGVVLRTAAAARPLPGFLVRSEVKSHGTMQRIEGPPLAPDARVALVDDVVTKGGSILRAADALIDAGARVVLALSILDRGEGGADAIRARGIEFRPLVTMPDLHAQPP